MSSVDAVAAVVDVLETQHIEYMIVGALSSNAYSIGRSTKDADIVISFLPGQLTDLVKQLGADFQLDPQQLFETLTGSIRTILTHLPTKFQIELFRLNQRDEHHVERFRRRRRAFLSEINREVWLPTVEDVVIQKLRWQRPKDVDDVINVLNISGSQIDWAYLRSWTTKHETDAKLLELLRDVPGISIPDQTA